jgi:hypothetical protein
VLMMNNKGFATIEAIALLSVFSTLVAYALGMFVVVHTGILNSIAGRTYAWETFAHRTNLNYFRDNRSGMDAMRESTEEFGYRSHSITSEHSPENQTNASFWATERYIASFEPEELIGRNQAAHRNLNTLTRNRERDGVNPVWIRTVYGICLNANCGGD